MLDQIKGLHHITSMARDARQNNAFFTGNLGLRRVKKTVNFDAPDVYHLYYADEFGTPGSVMTYFPFPNIGDGRPGTGEVGTTVFSVPVGSLDYWEKHLADQGVTGLNAKSVSGRSGSTSTDRTTTASPSSRTGRTAALPGPRAPCRPTRRSAASIPFRCACATPAPPPSCSSS